MADIDMHRGQFYLSLFRNRITLELSFSTGKSVSEALILASVNPQYDKRLFIELQEKCSELVFFL